VNNNDRFVVARVSRITFVILFVVCVVITIKPIEYGWNYFDFEAMKSRSMFIRAYGIPAYAMIIFFYIGAVYLLISRLIYFKNMIYIKDDNVFIFWRRLCRVSEIDFQKIEFTNAPIGITFNLMNGKRKKLNTSFSDIKNEEIVKAIKSYNENRSSQR
jgi:hypothetical protein